MSACPPRNPAEHGEPVDLAQAVSERAAMARQPETERELEAE
jgi:hypothetical protein